jgi:hypothetical protein
MIADKCYKILEEDLIKLPDYKQYVQDLQKLREFNFNGASPDEIAEKCYDVVTHFPFVSIFQNPEIFNQHYFYRVRRNIDTNNEDIDLIQTYSYPMPSFCQSNGRANIKGKSVFYCSDEVGGALFECKPQKGDEGYLSIWKPIASRPIKFGMLTSPDIPTDNPWHELTSEIFDMVRDFYKEKTPKKYEHFLELYRFIGERFMNESEPYSLTSSLSHRFMYQDKGLDLILYPSSETENKFCNFAIHPNTVHTQLRFEKVIRFLVKSVKGSRIEYSLREVGEPKETNIIWRSPRPEDKEFMK